MKILIATSHMQTEMILDIFSTHLQHEAASLPTTIADKTLINAGHSFFEFLATAIDTVCRTGLF